MSHGKHFTLFTASIWPNGWKVIFVLRELGLDFEPIYLDLMKNEQKSPEHVTHNPNGRIPTLIDHKNDDFVVWESCAIMTYLVEKYDTSHTISVSDAGEKILQLQWLFFQASGQGPYFGQAGWFSMFHPEKLPSAIERYQKETLRVFGVLEGVLSQQAWLVGGKCTIADFAFIPWNIYALENYISHYNGFDFARDFPAVHRWHSAVIAREAVSKALEEREAMK